MIVRRIRPDEVKRVQEFFAVAFEAHFYTNKDPMPFYEELIGDPQQRGDQCWQSQWAAFEDDDRTMISTFGAVPFRVNFDGHEVGMRGIGGVSTLPQYRRRGGIRACFESALPAMYAEGTVFSYLYPFSTAYYRKFGYELGCDAIRYKLLLSHMPKVELGGYCKLLEQGVDLLEDIKSVYHSWQTRYNMMTVEDELDYQWVVQANPFHEQEYTYVYYADSGAPLGFLSFKLDLSTPCERNMRCTRFYFEGKQGFYGLLNLLLSLAADHRYAIISLPADLPLTALLPEHSQGAVSRELEARGMARVVNVEEALRLARMRGDGELVLEISDGQIPQNNGRFEVVFAQGTPNRVCKTEKPADLRMRIQEFSCLILGRYGADELSWLADAVCYCSPEKAAKVFYRKPLYITHPF
ncbi:MAG: GNAT family N-acetyltransferase [Clostridia bacterium]